MSNISRREKIEAMLTEDPHDQFLRYSLAMELDKEDRHDESLVQLSELCATQTPLIAAFFMAAQQEARLGRIADAQLRLREGIEQARSQGDSHAAAEMSEFLISLGE